MGKFNSLSFLNIKVIQRIILCWVIIIFSKIISFSQSDSNWRVQYLNQFRKTQIISNDQYNDLIPLTLSNEISSPGILMAYIFQFKYKDAAIQFLSNAIASNKVKRNVYNNPGTVHILFPKGFNTDFERLKLYTDNIYQTGIIDNEIHDYLLSSIYKDSLFSEAQVLKIIQDKLILKEWLAPSRIHPYIDTLKNAGVVNEKNYSILNNVITNGGLKDNFQLLDYCNQSLIIDLTQYSGDLQNYYPKVYEKIRKQFFPESIISDFKTEVNNSNDSIKDGYALYNIKISFKIDGKKYMQECTYDPGIQHIRNSDIYMSMDNFFYEVFNRILADRKSEYRIHYVRSCNPIDLFSDYRFGLIALKKEQSDLLTNDLLYDKLKYLDFRSENYSATFSVEKIEQLINAYDSIGLLSHLDKNKINEGLIYLQQESIYDYATILFKYDLIISKNDELWNYKNPYEELTKEFSDYSRGIFFPKHVHDNFKKSRSKKQNSLSYTFELNDKKYAVNLNINGDTIDYRFVELFSKAMNENGIDGEYYSILDGQGWIFLTKKQYLYLKEHQADLFTNEY